MIDLEGCLYWYEGPNLQATSVVPHVEVKGEGALTYAEYAEADLDSEVTIEAYVQATQSWWEDKITVYAQDYEGGYFIYNMACTEEESELLVPGQKIRVTGFKSEWAGEVEIVDASFELLDGNRFVARPVDVTELLGTDELVDCQNRLVSFKDLVIEDYGDGSAFAYKNPEEKTDDLYFKASLDGEVYEFCVEYYLCNEETAVYDAVQNLKIGDTVDITAFLYWYEGANPHVIAVDVK